MDKNQDSGIELSELTCPYCYKNFSQIYNKNKHIKRIHQKKVKRYYKSSHIVCPLCAEDEPSGTYNELFKHLDEEHDICMNEIVLDFSNITEFDNWQKQENIEGRYAVCRHLKKNNGYEKHYACNRSDLYGYQSNCTKRTRKTGGSIRIKGVCPSRLIVSSYENGNVAVKYQTIHVGHEEELRYQRLSSTDKSIIVDKLRQGVSMNKILEEAREASHSQLKRINLLNKKEVYYLKSKHNIKKQKNINISHEDEYQLEEEISNDGNEHTCQFIKEQMLIEEAVVQDVTRNKEIDDLDFFLTALDEEEYDKFMSKIRILKQGTNAKNELSNTKIKNQEFQIMENDAPNVVIEFIDY